MLYGLGRGELECSELKRWFPRVLRCVVGVLLCGMAALLASLYSAQHAWRAFVPIAFVFVIVLLAARYGMAVALLGAAMTALVFAYYMFPPHRSFQITSSTERANVAWMLVGSVAISYLVTASSQQQHRK